MEKHIIAYIRTSKADQNLDLQLVAVKVYAEKHGLEYRIFYEKESGGKAIFGMLAVFAEFERNIISDRTKSGLQAAKKHGKNAEDLR